MEKRAIKWGKRVTVIEVPVKRRRGRPKQRWLDNIKNDLSERELSGEDAQYRVKTEAYHKKHRPHIQMGKDAEEEEYVGLIIKDTRG